MPVVGDALTFKAVFYDLDSAIRTDVTVAVAVRKPDGTAISPAPTVTQVGNWYEAGVTGGQNDAAGEWVATFTATDDGDVVPLAAPISIFVDSVLGAIKAKTDALPSDPADQSAVENAITAAQTAILAALADAGVSVENIFTADPADFDGDANSFAARFLAQVGSVVAALGGGTVVYVPSVVTKDGNIRELVSGDAYTANNGRALRWEISDSLLPDPATADARTFRLRRRRLDDNAGQIIINDVAVDVVTIGGKRYFQVELLRDQSGLILDAGNDLYEFEIELVWMSGETQTDDSPVTPLFGIVKKTIVFDNA